MAKVEPVKQELPTLKNQINDMCIAIFGNEKVFETVVPHIAGLSCLPNYWSLSPMHVWWVGNHNLVEQLVVKLKAIYKFIEQLYVGGSYSIMATQNSKAPPKYIMDMLKGYL